MKRTHTYMFNAGAAFLEGPPGHGPREARVSLSRQGPSSARGWRGGLRSAAPDAGFVAPGKPAARGARLARPAALGTGRPPALLRALRESPPRPAGPGLGLPICKLGDTLLVPH